MRPTGAARARCAFVHPRAHGLNHLRVGSLEIGEVLDGCSGGPRAAQQRERRRRVEGIEGLLRPA